MTVIVVASEEPAQRVADVLSDREVRTAATIADARDLLDETEPTLVIVDPSLPHGDGTDILAAVESDDAPATPVLELVDTDANDATDTDESDAVDGADETDVTEDGTVAANADSDTDEPGFDDRVSLADPDALRTAVRLAVAVSEYREATNAFYDLCRLRSTDESIDPAELDDARQTAGDRLTAVQRITGGETPFDRLLTE